MSREVETATRSPWLFASLRGYRREWLTKDVIAGLTVWAVLVRNPWPTPPSQGSRP